MERFFYCPELQKWDSLKLKVKHTFKFVERNARNCIKINNFLEKRVKNGLGELQMGWLGLKKKKIHPSDPDSEVKVSSCGVVRIATSVQL